MSLKKVLSSITFLLLLNFTGNAQSEKEYLSVYDSIIGKENILITNGFFHLNTYRVNDHKNIYFSNENYAKGSVTYLNQNYYNLDLKYDSYNDELIYRPNGNSEKNGVILIQSNVASFEYDGLKFVNLNLKKTNDDDFIKGYYEEKIKNSTLVFYIKHYKSKREVFVDKNVLVEFSDQMEFIIYSNNKFNEISSKKSIINLFPENKSYINEYFKNNGDLRKKDKSAFFTKLFQNISQ